jgi:hypothetical protein
MGNFLTLKGLEQVLKQLKERLATKDHKHTVKDITDLKQVAKTGRYSDLTGTPIIPSVEIAKENKIGLMMPGKGMMVDSNGSISLKIDDESGIYIDENGFFKVQKSDENSSVFKFDGNSWLEIYDKMVSAIAECMDKKIIEATFIVENKKTEKTIYIKIDERRMKNMPSIVEFVFQTIEENDAIFNDNFVTMDGYCDTKDDFKYCELLRFLSNDTIDIVELFIYKLLISYSKDKVLSIIGKPLPNIVEVYDTRNRIESIDFQVDSSFNENKSTSYILTVNSEEGESTYVPISVLLTRE